MDTFKFLITHFFTHKDFLPEQIPGTLYTPLQISTELLFTAFIIWAVFWTIRHQKYIRTIFICIFISLVTLEIFIDLWDCLAGLNPGFDPAVTLPFYPCSIFMFILPMMIWGKGLWKQMACGYTCTLGLIGALINFLYPIARLGDYSCISFPAFHTFLYHGSMLYAALVLLFSGIHCMHHFSCWWTPFLASIPGLLLSLPANLMNYSPYRADYMYFTGQHPLSRSVFGDAPNAITVTACMYVVYLLVPTLFYYLPWAGILLGAGLKNLAKQHAKKLRIYISNRISK